MTISVLPLKPYDRQQVNAFLSFSFRIYREYPLWVPPLEFEVRQVLSPGKHPLYRYAQPAFFLARDTQGNPIGRLAKASMTPQFPAPYSKPPSIGRASAS